MRKLLFIDNDDERRTKQDLHYSEDFLTIGGKLPEAYVKEMELLTDFWRMDRDTMFKTIFDTDKAIVTWSVYCANGVYSSKNQLNALMSGAGRYGIKDKIYIDCSGEIIKALTDIVHQDEKGCWSLLNGIMLNNIITVKEWEPVRIMVDIKGRHESPFTLEPINLKTILS